MYSALIQWYNGHLKQGGYTAGLVKIKRLEIEIKYKH